MSRKPKRKKHFRIDSEHIGLTAKSPLTKNMPFRRVIAHDTNVQFVNHAPVKREYYLHATKGYRSLRV